VHNSLVILVALSFAASIVGPARAEPCAEGALKLRLIDHATSPGTVMDNPGDLSNTAFRAFVSGVMKDLPARLAHIGACPTSGRQPATIDFVRVPLVTSGNAAFPPLPDLPPDAPAGCRIVSPWLRLAISEGSLTAIFVLNERQIAADKALLAEPDASVAGSLPPFTQSEFERLAQLYADLAITGTADAATLRTHIPVELLWLFRRAPQTTMFPFADGARAAINDLSLASAPFYVTLTRSLVDSCPNEAGLGREYLSIIDTAGTVDLSTFNDK
jgi:hypothetical protein